MGQIENNKIGMLFLFHGAIIYFSSLFIESLIENLSFYLKLISLLGIIVYSIILIINLLSFYYPNLKISKRLKSKSLEQVELSIIIIFGIISFLSFLDKLF